MAAYSPFEVDTESDIALSSTKTLEFDNDTLRAIAEVYMIEGNKEYREKEFNNAIHFFTEGIKVNCKDEVLNAKLYSNRATAHFVVGYYTDTLNDAKAAIKLRPTFIKAIVKGASACMELNMFDEALTLCFKGLSIDENNKKLLELESRVLDELYKNKETQMRGKVFDPSKRLYMPLERAVDRKDVASTAAESKGPEMIKHLLNLATGDIACRCTVYGALYFELSKHDKSIEWFEKELAIRKETGHREAECASYKNLGQIYYQNSQVEKAIGCYEKGLEIAEEMGNREKQKESLSRLGQIYYQNSQIQKAIGCYKKGLEIAEEMGNRTEQKESLSRLGFVLIKDLHQCESGIECCNQALDIMKETGDKHGERNLYNLLAEAYHALGLNKNTIKALEKALEIDSTIGDEEKINYYHNLAGEYRAIGNCKKSAEYYEKAANVSEASGQCQNEVSCYHNLGDVYQKTGQYERSVEYYEKALLISEERGYTKDIVISCNKLGLVYNKLDLHGKSMEYREKALRLLKGAGDRQGEMECLSDLGMTHHKLGQSEKAIEYLEKSLEISTAAGDREGMSKVNSNLGRVYCTLGEYEKSVEFLKKALDSTNNIIERVFIYRCLSVVAGYERKSDEIINYLERAVETCKEYDFESHHFISSYLLDTFFDSNNEPGANIEKAKSFLLGNIKNYEHVREDLEDEYKILVDDRNGFTLREF
ncbi:uncharacterized protein LOC144655981 [Oculina patagonica]